MNILLPLLLAFCAILTPVNAAPAQASKPLVIIGGFQVGKTFTLPVTFRGSSAAVGNGVFQPAVPPKGIPAFAPGQQVKLTIGKKGQLIGPGFKIPFHSESAGANTYIGIPTRKVQNPPAATVSKDSSGEPIGIGLQFVLVRSVNGVLTTYSVNYALGVVPH